MVDGRAVANGGRCPPVLRAKGTRMRRRIIIEIDDAASPKDLQAKPSKGLKRIIRLIADQVAWGDKSRPVVDRQGNAVGEWTLIEE